MIKIAILIVIILLVLLFQYSKEGLENCNVNYLYLHPPWKDKLIRRDNDVKCDNTIFSHYYN